MSAASDCRRIGVILAAGRGGRMGGKKQLTPWPTVAGTIPLVAAAYDAIRSICDETVVVLGHDADAVVAALSDRPFHRADSSPAAPMFESIRAGLREALRLDANSTIVLQPGDHPEVAPSTLTTLTAWSLKRPGQAIIPQHASQGGHPVLIPSSICTKLLENGLPAGLGAILARSSEPVPPSAG